MHTGVCVPYMHTHTHTQTAHPGELSEKLLSRTSTKLASQKGVPYKRLFCKGK